MSSFTPPLTVTVNHHSCEAANGSLHHFSKQSRWIAFLFVLTLPLSLFAQAPAISYTSPQTYATGTVITPLTPTSSGVAPPGYSNYTVTLGSGFNFPTGVTVDAAGNVYVADASNNAVKKIPAGGGSPVVLGSGFSFPFGIAVDAAGNVYVADAGNNQVEEIPVGGGSLITLGSGFNSPCGIALDAAGNVYVSDSGNNAIKEIPSGGGGPITIASGFNNPVGVAVDAAGNIYVGDANNNAVKMIPSGGGSPVVLGSGFSFPYAIAVDAAGNVYVADSGNKAVKEIMAGGGTPVILESGFSSAYGVAVDGAGNVYVADAIGNTVKEIKPIGGYYIGPFLPADLGFNNATGTISGTPTGNSPAKNYTVTAYNAAGSSSATVNITVTPPPTISYSSPQTYTIGTAITALTPVSSWVAAPGYSSTSVTLGSGFNHPRGVAVDATGNLYLADYLNNAVKRIPKGGGAPVTIGSGFLDPIGVAVDVKGNVYVADQGNNAIKEIPAGGGSVVTLGSFLAPSGVAIDDVGNIYVTDGGEDAVYEIPAGGGSPIIIDSFSGFPSGVAVDALGNIYVTTSGGNNSILEKIPVGGGPIVSLGSGFVSLSGVAVDAAGNVYVVDYSNSVVKEIPAVGSASIVTIGSGFINPDGIAVDGAGNLYIADSGNNAVKEIKPIGGYYIGPFLPPGLSFANATGIISGTPTVINPQTNYKVTAYNAVGSSSVIVKIEVTAPSNNANLVLLKPVPGGMSPAFSSATTSYTESVANTVTSITVTPTTAVSVATVKVNGTAVTSGTASGPITLNLGANVISVVVTAQDGVTTQTYSVTVTRAPSSVATLSSFKPSKGTLSPVFSSATTSYTASVVNGVTSLTITPTATNAGATIKVDGAVVASGSASQNLPLVVGANSFPIKVTAQDGTTTKTYTVVVTRGPSANCYLSNLKPSAGSVSPAFSASKTAYTTAVVNGAATITVTPFTAVPTSTATVNGTAVASGKASMPIALNVGSNTITTVVTAQDGTTTRTYTLTVTRAASSNANLSAFKISKGTLTPAFVTGTTTYTASVANGVTSMTVTPTTADTTATITVNSITIASGTSSGSLALAVGSNTITTVVTAQDGVTIKTYSLTVTRAASGADSYDPGISVTTPTEAPSLDDDIIFVHQAISPNGDGINDFLVIDGIQAYPDNKLSIMNRNGQLVYEAKGYDNSSKVFDGHSNKNGRMQLPGTYFYELDYTVNSVTKHKTGILVLKY